MVDKPGFGFRPYDEELVGYYLRNKIVGDTSLVEGVISEVNICSFDPWDLRFQSKIKSKDPFWYFFSRRENKYANGNRQNRRTRSGFWKLTGDPVDVTDQWGHLCGVGGKIGHKRVLMFIRGKNNTDKTKSDWVMHELHYTLLPEDERTYVICRLEYKGDDVNILSANATNPTPTFGPNMTNSAGSVVNQSLQENSGSYNTYSEYDSANRGPLFRENFDMQHSAQGNSGYFNNFFDYYASAKQGHLFAGDVNMQQQAPYSAPYGDETQMIWENEIIKNYEFLVDERTCMEEHYNEHRPKNPVTGVLPDDSGDSDTDSMIGRDTWSSPGSVGSSNGPYHAPIDDIPSLDTMEPLHNYEAQEPPKQLILQLQGKEKVINKQKSEWKMAEDSSKKAPSTNTVKQSWIVLKEINQRNSQWIYLKNMIIGFLLFISIIGWIILVG